MGYRLFRSWPLLFGLVLGLAALTARAADAPDLQIGPYLQSVLQESAVIMWHSGTAAPGRVEFGEGATLDRRAAETGADRVHEVRLTGLKAGTRYRYRVVWGQNASDVYSFHTAPPAGTRRFRLALYGDNRTQPPIHHAIAQRVLAERPDLVLNTGDLVAAGTREELWEPQFFGPARELLREIPYWTCLGNHEQNGAPYYRYFSLPNNEAYYSFDYANAHIIALDSNQPYDAGSPQYRWLEEDLKKARADWKIVFFHHPMFSAHPTRSINATRWAWEPLFLKYGVNLVLTGHDHHYQRCRPIGSMDGEAITYHFTSGGGGAPLYPVEKKPWTAVTQSVHNYMVLDFDGRKVHGKAVTDEGKQIDDFTIDLDRRPPPGELVVWEPIAWERSLEEQLRAAAPSRVPAGDFRIEGSLALTNPLPRTVGAELVWDAAPGWRFEPSRKTLTLKPGAAERVAFTASARWPDAYPVPGAILRLGEGATGFRNREIRLEPLRVRPEREVTTVAEEVPPAPAVMILANGRERMAQEVAFAVRRTVAGLEVRARIPQPNAAALAARETARDAARVWNRDESLLVRLAPPGGSRYDLAVNSRGTLYDARDGDTAWNGAWTAEAKPAAGGWESTLRIPWSDLGLTGPPAPGAVWRFNLVRTDGDRRETGEWVPTFGAAADAARWGELRLP
jgi:Calcineurin-like phosphoesterase/Purple acid Phosphatase, N-terminal domain